MRWPFQIVGNLASWYNGVKDNPKCVAAVNLNDPFFQHRDVNFILDLDAKEIFDEAVNYVTVNVRKPRSTGNAFEDRVTIDAKYVKEKGITASVTYARGEDKNAEAYEYQAQWSLKGGNIFPAAPRWEKGSWEGVTLAPPVVPRKVEVEGDLEAMKASDVTRVTVQIHYPKFGQEVEENIHISPAKNEPIVMHRIFMDRGARGYAYRLIVNHKTEGKLVAAVERAPGRRLHLRDDSRGAVEGRLGAALGREGSGTSRGRQREGKGAGQIQGAAGRQAMKGYRWIVLTALVVLACAGSAAAQQQILLDKQARGGDLVFLRDLNDEKAWYYVVDKPKLATDANGRPQFSFLRYVENQSGAEGADAAREGEGGGIVHALVSLSVSREQLQAAQRELQRCTRERRSRAR